MWTCNGWYEEARQDAAAAVEYTRARADHIIDTYAAASPASSREDVVARIIASNEERLASVPSLIDYPELRGMRELLMAKSRGAADGAGLTAAQSAALEDNMYLYRRELQSPARSLGCSYVYFPKSDHGPLLANNLDSSPEEPFEAPEWRPLNEHLLYGGVSCGIFDDEQSSESFPVPMLPLLSRYCRSTEEAVEMLTRYKLFWGPGNAIVVDRNHRVAMIEKSACRIGVRYSDDGFGFITAMTMAEPGMAAYLHDRRQQSLVNRDLPQDCADSAYWAEADQRHRLMAELLDEGRATPTLDKIREIIQFRDADRGRVCYAGDVLYADGPPAEHTLRTTIWLLAEGRALWWAKEGDTPSFEHPMPDVTYDNVLTWAA